MNVGRIALQCRFANAGLITPVQNVMSLKSPGNRQMTPASVRNSVSVRYNAGGDTYHILVHVRVRSISQGFSSVVFVVVEIMYDFRAGRLFVMGGP